MPAQKYDLVYHEAEPKEERIGPDNLPRNRLDTAKNWAEGLPIPRDPNQLKIPERNSSQVAMGV